MNDIPQVVDQGAADVVIADIPAATMSGTLARPHYKLNFTEGPHVGVPIWLISMTDLMGIVLTFFVLLFTMSSQTTPETWSAKKESQNGAASAEMNAAMGAAGQAGDKDTISLNKIDFNQSLNLSYLKSVLETLSKENPVLQKVRLIDDAENKRLIVTLPHDLLFEKGKAEINTDGQTAIRALTGVLKNIPNGIEIIGHADPTQATAAAPGQPVRTNWAISLARATAVASFMSSEGYSRTLPVMGASSGLFDQLPKTLPEAEREALSRRVDLIINLHDNTFQQRFGIGPE